MKYRLCQTYSKTGASSLEYVQRSVALTDTSNNRGQLAEVDRERRHRCRSVGPLWLERCIRGGYSRWLIVPHGLKVVGSNPAPDTSKAYTELHERLFPDAAQHSSSHRILELHLPTFPTYFSMPE